MRPLAIDVFVIRSLVPTFLSPTTVATISARPTAPSSSATPLGEAGFEDGLTFSRVPQWPIAESLLVAGVDGAPTGFDALLVQDLLERVSELEATYHLNSKLWGYPQLRKTRYWDRGKIWVVIDQMCHIREAEAAFRALSGRSPPKARSLLNDASLRLSAWNLKSHDKLATAPPEASGSGSGLSSLPVEPHALPRASATKFLTSYYLSLSQIRDSLKQWRTEL